MDGIQEDFWFTVFRKGELRKLWRPQIQIIFMLKGKGQIRFADMKTSYTVQEDDIFVINSFEMHSLELEENAIALSFTDYVMLLRVAYASKMLRGKKTISEITLESGFPNVNAMIIAFKRYKGATPGEYRKNQELEGHLSQTEEPLRDGGREDFASLMKYAAKKAQTELPAENMTEISVDINGRKQRISTHWKRIINAGYARSLTDGTVQKEKRYLQERIGFEFIRIKGIVDDDMCLLRTDMNGKHIVNYVYAEHRFRRSERYKEVA